MNSEATPQVHQSAVWRWWVISLLLLATTINYMDRQTLSNAAVRVTKEFSLSKEAYGTLEANFGYAFAVGSLVFGFLADRLRVYWLYPLVLMGWSLMGVISAHTHDYNSFMLCRILLGFFEAGHWPCALKTTFALLTPEHRTMGNSVLQSGASVGAVITPPLMLWLMTEETSSWRLAFQVVGAVGLVWVVFWFVSIRKTDLDQPTQNGAETKESGSLLSVLRDPRLWALAILIFGIQTCWHLFRAWLPMFLQEGRGYSETEALAFNSVYYIGTDIGCFCSGLATIWLAKNRGLSAHSARRVVYTAACCLTSLSVLIMWLPKGPALLVAILLVGAGALALFPCYYSFVQEISAKHLGLVTGLLSTWVWLASSRMHQFFGKVVDQTHSFDIGMSVAGLAPWLGVIALVLLWRKPAADSAKI